MKTFTAAFAVLFVAALCYQVSSTPPSLHNSKPCCKTFASNPLPLHLVESYWHTSCFVPAVIFMTTKENLVCANPKEKWVQDRMNHLDSKKRHG